MYHHAVHTLDDRALFTDWEDAAALWRRVGRLPGLIAACLMANHLHVLAVTDVRGPLSGVISGYARWRNARTGATGPLFRPLEPPSCPPTPKKQRTDLRYVHANPTAARAVLDPLAWPFSTHRDAVGLAVPAVRKRVQDPAGFHRWVCEHPSVLGGDLPFGRGTGTIPEVLAALSEVTRTPMDAFLHRGRARATFLASARVLADAPAVAIADFAGVSRQAVYDARPVDQALLSVVERVIGDARFPGLAEGDPRHSFARRLGG
jgi:hypothetical protein